MAGDTERNDGAPAATPPKECVRFHAAYAAMKADPKQENYIALLEALEADVKENAVAYVPVETKEDVAALQQKGTIKWMALETPKGRMLSIFTSREQAVKKGAVGNAGVSLPAFFRLLLDNRELAGFAVNPFDDNRGLLLDRKNLEVVMQRVQSAGVPRLDVRFVSNACCRLFDSAVGVPTPVYEFAAELGALGGPDGVLKPVLDKWQAALRDGAFKPEGPDAYVKTIVKDVMTTSFIAGVFAKQGVEMVRKADPATCLARVPYLKDDLVQNTDEYLVVLSMLLRQRGLRNEGHVWVTLANNIGMVGYGAMCFGFGWGLAKCCESEGPEAMEALKARQAAFRQKMKAAEEEEAARKTRAQAQARVGG
ncbi:MAG: SseB family protein [Kiritimatiellia bacterium]